MTLIENPGKPTSLECIDQSGAVLRLPFNEDQNVHLYPAQRGHTSQINYLHINNKDRVIVSASDDSTIALWCLDTHKLLNQFFAHRLGVMCAKFSHSNQYIASTGRDCFVRLWDYDSQCDLLFKKKGADPSDSYQALRVCTFTHNDKYILTGDYSGTVKTWSIEKKECITERKAENISWITCIETNHDDSLIAACGEGYVVVLWKFDSITPHCIIDSHSLGVLSLSFSRMNNKSEQITSICTSGIVISYCLEGSSNKVKRELKGVKSLYKVKIQEEKQSFVGISSEGDELLEVNLKDGYKRCQKGLVGLSNYLAFNISIDVSGDDESVVIGDRNGVISFFEKKQNGEVFCKEKIGHFTIFKIVGK